jgi:5-carboxymethyl-2-hydroxymuconate isomerase
MKFKYVYGFHLKKKMFPELPIISMNVREFEKASYCNKSMV